MVEKFSDTCYINGDYAAVLAEIEGGERKWVIIVKSKDRVRVLALYNETDKMSALEDLKERSA